MDFRHGVQVEACFLLEVFFVCWIFREVVLGGFSGRTSRGKVPQAFPYLRCGTDGFCSCFLEVLCYRFFQFFQVLCRLEGLSYFLFHPCKSSCLVLGDSVVVCSVPVQFHLYLADLLFC